jgi:hypothetical protein
MGVADRADVRLPGDMVRVIAQTQTYALGWRRLGPARAHDSGHGARGFIVASSSDFSYRPAPRYSIHGGRTGAEDVTLGSTPPEIATESNEAELAIPQDRIGDDVSREVADPVIALTLLAKPGSEVGRRPDAAACSGRR